MRTGKPIFILFALQTVMWFGVRSWKIIWKRSKKKHWRNVLKLPNRGSWCSERWLKGLLLSSRAGFIICSTPQMTSEVRVMQPRILLSVRRGKARKIRFCIKWKNLSEPVMVHRSWTDRADTAIFSMPIRVGQKWTSEILTLLICLWQGRSGFRSVVVWYVRKSWNKSFFSTGRDNKAQSVSLSSCTRLEYILSFFWTNGWNIVVPIYLLPLPLVL